MSAQEEPERLSRADIARLLGAFEDRTAALGSLGPQIDLLADEVRGLRADVTARPPRSEIDYKRRRAALAVVCLVFVGAWATDWHSESCGPGARAENVLNLILKPHDKPLTREQIEAASRADSEFEKAACDASVPFHGHHGGPYPTGWALVGLLFYALLGGYAAHWMRAPLQPGYDDPDDDTSEGKAT